MRVLALTAAVCMAPVPARAASELFRSVDVEAAAGMTLAQGNLDGVLDAGPAAGLRFSTSYYRAWRAHAFVHYSATRAEGMDVSLQAFGMGLEWGGLPAWLPRPLAGVAMYAARLPEEEDPADRYVLLHGGESEFGAYPGLRWQWGFGAGWLVSATARYDVIFTKPEPSRLLTLQCGAGWGWK